MTLEDRRRWAIASGTRIETITAILARRRRCSQIIAMRLAKAGHVVGISVPAETLAMNLFAEHPVFSVPPLPVVD